MREGQLQNFIDRNPLRIPPGTPRYVPVLLSDSKGIRLKQVDGGELPIEYLCYGGARTTDGIFTLQQKLIDITKKHGKPALVYVWLGTCDVTQKAMKNRPCIEIRESGQSTPNNVLATYKSIREFIIRNDCRVKFIGFPIYSVSKYNHFHGNPKSNIDAIHDAEVSTQIGLINDGILELNSEVEKVTLKFNVDLIFYRRREQRVNFDLLTDGLHPGHLLSKKWLLKLQLDIVKENYHADDTVEAVDRQELLAFD